MLRRLFTLLAVISLTARVSTSALWAWSYRGVEAVHYLPGADPTNLVAGTRNGSPAWYVAASTEYALFSSCGSLALQVHQVRHGSLADVTDHLESLPVWRVSRPIDDANRRQAGTFLYGVPGEVRLGPFGGYLRSAAPGGTDALSLFVFPHWSVCLLTAVLPAAWIAPRARRRRRMALGHCRACGYDLRASPGRCPECGTEPSGSARQTRQPEAADPEIS